VVTVTVKLLAAPLLTATLAGAVHVALSGAPLHAKVTVPLKPWVDLVHHASGRMNRRKRKPADFRQIVRFVVAREYRGVGKLAVPDIAREQKWLLRLGVAR